MNTDGRLMEAYGHAREIEIDDTSKFVFMSDVHRGDNSISDEFAHNQNIYYHALNHYYNEDYTYVEVGDGDELWEHSKFEHIRSAHSDVYWLLQKFYFSGRLKMLFGNHNMHFRDKTYVKQNLFEYYDEYLEQRGELFPGIEIDESLMLTYKKTGQKIFIVHGHQGDMLNDQLWKLSMAWMRYFWRVMHVIGFRNPASPAKNRVKRHKIEKNFESFIKRHGVMLVCGHTHRPKFPNPGEVPYFNDGCCIHPRCITGLEICDGKIMLVDWRVRPDEQGALFISKKIIRGPERIEAFMIK
jgi:UDP-2,3-diacylglucosamine pyrophosphatase LpxH